MLIRIVVATLFATILTGISLSPANAIADANVQEAPVGPFQAGAAKIEITPAADQMPAHYRGVLDPIYSRAIVVDNGSASVALVSIDALRLPETVADRLAEAIAAATGIPTDHLVITATSTHSVPAVMANPAAPTAADLEWERRIVSSVVLAKRKLQPSRMRFGTGASWINVQRDRIDPETRRWWEGPDYDGVSDKTVSVLRFVAADGRPIAAYYNYGVFNVITGMLDQVSGDVTGAASHYIEAALGDDFVAVFSLGAHGDQNPIFFNQTYELRSLRIQDFAARGEDIANAMPPPGGAGLNRDDPQVARLLAQQIQVNGALGLMLGEEVLHVMRSTRRETTQGRITSTRAEVTCPGRRRTNEGRGGVAGTYVDAEPVPIRLGLVMLGDVAIGHTSASPYAAIGLRFRKESPYAMAMLSTRANGGSAAYVPDDASYGHETFAVLNSRLKPGCGERAIVDGIVDMMPAQ